MTNDKRQSPKRQSPKRQSPKRQSPKMLGKKLSEKTANKVFLYSHEYRDQKMGGKKLAKQFFQKHTNSASKKCWGKNRQEKVPKTFFL